MTPSEERAIMQKALDHYGKKVQVIVCIEELAELIHELTKYLRGEPSLLHLTEEAADVSIVLDEIIECFHIRPGVESFRRTKLKRLLERIDNEELHGAMLVLDAENHAALHAGLDYQVKNHHPRRQGGQR